MKQPLKQAVEALIEQRTGKKSPMAAARGVAGGCISQAILLELTDGRHYFLKWNPAPLPRMFACECEGLEALAASGTLRVPAVLGIGGADGSDVPPFLVMEAIAPGRQGAGQQGPRFFEEFGQQFATLHRKTSSERFGFVADNYLGATPQPNPWTTDWCEFWRTHRLGFQLDLARRGGHADATLNRLGDQLLARLEDWIATPEEPACLLHGDLWGGNFLVDENVRAVLIDPAAYYGRREADLAMTQLFGGFSDGFYRAYEEVWPLEEGHEERLEIYKLYHVLNHLNLFGSSYRGQCVSILKRLVP